MSTFEFSESKLGKFETIKLINKNTNEYIEIAKYGATLLKFVKLVNGKLFDIIDGFQTEEELENGKGARCWIMTPFSNRIENGTYTFLGKEYKISPTPPRSIVIHGFTSTRLFNLEKVIYSDDFILVEFLNKSLRKGNIEGYPFDIDVKIRYKFEKNKLFIEVEGINVGDIPAPFFSGWHPYFKTNNDGINDLILECEAGSIIKTNEKLIPLPEPYTYEKLDKNSDYYFGKHLKKQIGSRIFDLCYSDLKPETDGLIRTSLIDLNNKFKLTLFQEGGLTLLFSGDTLANRPRKSFAIEPVQFMTNAFNRPELIDKLTILPGNSSNFNFGVETFNYESN